MPREDGRQTRAKDHGCEKHLAAACRARRNWFIERPPWPSHRPATQSACVPVVVHVVVPDGVLERVAEHQRSRRDQDPEDDNRPCEAADQVTDPPSQCCDERSRREGDQPGDHHAQCNSPPHLCALAPQARAEDRAGRHMRGRQREAEVAETMMVAATQTGHALRRVDLDEALPRVRMMRQPPMNVPIAIASAHAAFTHSGRRGGRATGPTR